MLRLGEESSGAQTSARYVGGRQRAFCQGRTMTKGGQSREEISDDTEVSPV